MVKEVVGQAGWRRGIVLTAVQVDTRLKEEPNKEPHQQNGEEKKTKTLYHTVQNAPVFKLP